MLFVATVCGYCLWLLFVATICGYCLWLLFVATVCGYCLWLPVCGYCLWLLFVATVCRAATFPTSTNSRYRHLSFPTSIPRYPHRQPPYPHPGALTSLAQVVVRSSSSLPHLYPQVSSLLFPHLYPQVSSPAASPPGPHITSAGHRCLVVIPPPRLYPHRQPPYPHPGPLTPPAPVVVASFSSAFPTQVQCRSSLPRLQRPSEPGEPAGTPGSPAPVCLPSYSYRRPPLSSPRAP